MPEEEADMIEYLRSLGSVMAMPVRTVANVEQLVWRPVEEALQEADPTFLITPQKFVADMKLHIDENGIAANVVTTPALFYSRGQLIEQKTLYSTSLSVEWDDKPAEFVRWGRKVMQWVRRVAPGWYRYKHHRITTNAEAARAAGMEMVF
ncbi:MAG: hypothetical protein ABI467_22820 [Kofleriaceae bacterium]